MDMQKPSLQQINQNCCKVDQSSYALGHPGTGLQVRFPGYIIQSFVGPSCMMSPRAPCTCTVKIRTRTTRFVARTAELHKQAPKGHPQTVLTQSSTNEHRRRRMCTCYGFKGAISSSGPSSETLCIDDSPLILGTAFRQTAILNRPMYQIRPVGIRDRKIDTAKVPNSTESRQGAKRIHTTISIRQLYRIQPNHRLSMHRKTTNRPIFALDPNQMGQLTNRFHCGGELLQASAIRTLLQNTPQMCHRSCLHIARKPRNERKNTTEK